jgi:acylphosphatase
MPTLSLLAVGVAVCLAMTSDEPAEKSIGRTVFYSGRVQGVGFRYTAVAMSRDYPVTGWVKNLDDGRVQLVVEGPAKGVNDFLEAMRQRWKDNLKKEDVQNSDPTGKFKDFHLEY